MRPLKCARMVTGEEDFGCPRDNRALTNTRFEFGPSTECRGFETLFCVYKFVIL